MSWYLVDRKHWELTLGRFQLHRWCKGAPCSWHGWTGRHPVRIRIERS